MAYHDVLLEYEGDYASITMNRPERRNSLTLRHLEELIDAFETVGASDARGDRSGRSRARPRATATSGSPARRAGLRP